MRFLESIFALALFGLWAFCLIDVVMTPRAACRRLPKPAWLVMVFLLSWIGATLWLLAGRPRRAAQPASVPADTVAGQLPGRREYERIGAASMTSGAGDSQAQEEYLRQCRARADEQRARYQRSLREDQG